MMKRTIGVLAAIAALSVPGGMVAQEPTEAEAGVIAAVNAVFEGMAKGDTDALSALMMDESQLLAMGPRGPQWRSGDSFASGFEGREEPVIERMWNPAVMIDGPMAMLWAPYDVYVGERWIHCGTDVFQLARVEGVWKVAFIGYTATQPPDCKPHPEGPPKR